MVRPSVAALLATALLVSSSAHAANEATPPCPADGFQPLDDPYRGPGLAILIPPLAILQAMARDPLADQPRRRLTFRVVDPDGRPAEEAHVALLREGRRFIGEALHGGTLDLPDGAYTVVAAVPGRPGRWGQRRIEVREKGATDFEVRVDRTLPAVTTRPPTDLAADGRAPAGAPIRLAWSGLRQSAMTLAVTSPDEEGGPAQRETPIGAGPTSAIEMPPTEASWDVRLLLCAPRITVATWRIEVGPPLVRLAAPDRVTAGRTFEVTAAGRLGAEFELAVVGPDTENDVQSEKVERAKPRAKLTAPLSPGRWDLVYLADDHDRTVLARRPITVEAATIEISAPVEIRVGAPVRIAYPGSETGAGAVLSLWSKDGILESDDLPLDGSRLPAPVGDYELRLNARADRSVILARRPIRVVGKMIGAPDAVAVGSTVAVTFSDDPRFFDRLRILPRGRVPERFEKGPSVDPDEKRRAAITAPTAPGDYDLVLVDESPGTRNTVVIDRRPLTVR